MCEPMVLMVRVLALSFLLLLLLGLQGVSWRGICGLLGCEVRRRQASHHECLRRGLVCHGRMEQGGP